VVTAGVELATRWQRALYARSGIGSRARNQPRNVTSTATTPQNHNINKMKKIKLNHQKDKRGITTLQSASIGTATDRTGTQRRSNTPLPPQPRLLQTHSVAYLPDLNAATQTTVDAGTCLERVLEAVVLASALQALSEAGPSGTLAPQTRVLCGGISLVTKNTLLAPALPARHSSSLVECELVRTSLWPILIA
jgi:hypothetical protein